VAADTPGNLQARRDAIQTGFWVKFKPLMTDSSLRPQTESVSDKAEQKRHMVAIKMATQVHLMVPSTICVSPLYTGFT
jgi:hypothetical protein